LRKKANIKVRQPLQKAMLPVLDQNMQQQLAKTEDLIKSEVNIKKVEYITDTEGLISKKIKPNFKTLGAKVGAKMKAVAAAIGNFSQKNISSIENEGKYEINIDNEVITILLEDVIITVEDVPGWSVATKGSITVALDITITEDLKCECDAREFVNRVQNIRKERKFDLTDRIFVKILNNKEITPSLNQFKEYICAEILADSIEFADELSNGTEIEVNDNVLFVSITKKG
jgi:isoleucyl-tRNA synthetase